MTAVLIVLVLLAALALLVAVNDQQAGPLPRRQPGSDHRDRDRARLAADLDFRSGESADWDLLTQLRPSRTAVPAADANPVRLAA